MSTAATRSLRLGLRKGVPATTNRVRNFTCTNAVQFPTTTANHKSSVISSRALRLHCSGEQPPFSSRAFSSSDQFDEVSSIINENKVVVFSKTWCGFCQATKKLFEEMGVDAEVIELDKMANGDAIQASLHKLSGQRTVPNVFINGEHLGGNDATHAAKRSGKLEEMLQ